MKNSTNKFILTSLLSFLIVITLFSNISIASAEDTGLGAVWAGLSQSAGKAGISTTQTDLPTIIGRFVNYMFSIVGIIFMTVTLVGGYLWMTAGGNEEKIGKAKGFIVNGINGMIVIFLSYALVYTMLAALKAAAG